MKFYITVENTTKLKRSLLNLKLFNIISIPEILDQYGYTYESIDEYSTFIINKHIMDLINTYTKSKRIRGIIYSNPNVTDNVIYGLYESLKDIKEISDIVLFDDYNVPKLHKFYPLFEEIVFFPSVKKIRLIECTPIKELMNLKKGS